MKSSSFYQRKESPIESRLQCGIISTPGSTPTAGTVHAVTGGFPVAMFTSLTFLIGLIARMRIGRLSVDRE